MDEEGLSAPLVPQEPLACLLPLVTNQVPLEPNGTPDASDDQSIFWSPVPKVDRFVQSPPYTAFLWCSMAGYKNTPITKYDVLGAIAPKILGRNVLTLVYGF